jgi:hypothetical protein
MRRDTTKMERERTKDLEGGNKSKKGVWEKIEL